MSTKAKKRSARSASREETSGTPLAFILKWVGVVTAFTSLILGIVGVTKVAGEARERRRQIMAAVVVAAQAKSGGDYANAWHRLDQAQKTAEEGGELAKLLGRLDEPRRQLRHLREDVGMAWLRDTHLAEGQTFGSVVDPLLPVLEGAAAVASGARKGDLQAHIGWAYFLKSRDNAPAIDPLPQYREALVSDPSNPYAHVFWGHWILWHNGPLAEAQQHFNAAVTAQCNLPFVREIELAALRNNHSPTYDAELLRVANEMNQNHEKINDAAISHIWSVYYFAFENDAEYELINKAVPAGDQITLIEALYEGTDFDPSKIPLREASLARLEEAAGRRDAALRRWRALRANLPSGISESIAARCDAAIKRLSQPVGMPP